VETITEVKLWEYSFLSNWAANDKAIVQDVKNKKESAMDLLVKMYNLPYSDSRLKAIESLLLSLEENEPLENNTPILEPINDSEQKANELFNYLLLKGVLKNGN
jgi:hypothetical protein